MNSTLLDFIPKIRRLGNREAIRFHNGFRTWKLTYIELYRRIAALSDHLQDRGVGQDDRLLLWGENRAEWVIAFWASLARGIQVVPLDSRSSDRFVGKIQKEVDAKVLIHGETVNPGSLPLEKLSFSEFEQFGEKDDLQLVGSGPEGIVEIVYTSGTTGTPKGVVHRHRNLCANLRPFKQEINRYRKLVFPFQPIRFLNMLPLSHMFGQAAGLFIPVLLGGAVVFMRELHPGAVIETIHGQRVSVLVAVPRLLSQLQKHIEWKFHVADQAIRTRGMIGVAERWWRFRLVHSELGWKFWAMVVGGARLKPEIEKFWSRLGYLLIQGYGLTEASPIVAVNHPFKTKRGSVGKAIEGQQIKIADDGEILVRGESIASEYLAGRKHSQAGCQDSWLHTGDIGEIDSEGNLYYKGRKKDVIVTSEGLNVYPADVEAVLNQLPAVKESVVIASERDREEVVHAVLLLRDSSADGDELVRRANQILEPHQRIRNWSIWMEEDFPRTPSTLKVKRLEVAQQISVGPRHEETAPQPKQKKLGSLEAVLAEMSGTQGSQLQEEMRLSEDLGLSSLDRVELMSRLEDRWSIDLDEIAFSRLSDIGELKHLLESTQSSRVESRRTRGLQPPREGKAETLSEAAPSDAFERTDTPIPPPRWNLNLLVRTLRFLAQHTLILPLFRHYIDFTVVDREKLRPAEPPVIFAANHASHLDTVAVLAALPRNWRPHLAPAMLQEYFAAYFRPRGFLWKERAMIALHYHLACGLFNGYPLPQRMGGIRQALKYTGELVEQGYCPLVFPEGIRSPDGSLQSFKPGIGLMALRLGVPVVPVHIEGLFKVFSVHDKWPKKGTVRVTFGTPVDLISEQEYESATSKIETQLRQLARRSDGRG